MKDQRIKFLTTWLTATLCQEKFPTTPLQDVGQFATVIVQCVLDRQAQDGTTGLITYEEAMLDQRIPEAWKDSSLAESIPPSWSEQITRWLIGLGPTLYWQDTYYWMRGLQHLLTVYTVHHPEDPEGTKAAEELNHCIVQMLALRDPDADLQQLEALKDRAYQPFEKIREKVMPATPA